MSLALQSSSADAQSDQSEPDPTRLWLQPARQVIKKLKEGAMPPPKACKICSANFQETFNHEACVFHGEG